MWCHAFALVQNISVAEEIVSETFLAFVRSIPSFDVEAIHLHGWLRGVIQHKVADQRRQSSKHRRLLTAARDQSVGGNESAEVSSPLEIEETRQDVLAVLDRLPELQRLVLEWKHAEAQSVREIAARLGQSEKSVESMLYRARKEFRRLYELECAGNSRTSMRTDARAPTLKESL